MYVENTEHTEGQAATSPFDLKLLQHPPIPSLSSQDESVLSLFQNEHINLVS